MPYRKTQFAAGQYYHVFNRGFCKLPIFRDKKSEYRFFLRKAYTLSKRYNVVIESQAMMSNHFHFILVQNEDNEGIQHMVAYLQLSFAKYYNKRHGRKGPVFEGRFKAKFIHDDRYYFDVTNYVFKNPIK
ncbi:transposase [Candidatus Peregrinibacteria bacterium]|nr:transposase [Candidatus Peregrinibacteria bacterium]